MAVDRSKVFAEGGESVVQVWKQGRVLKHSREHGFALDLHAGGGGAMVLGLRPALPSEQRERLRLSKSLFGDSARIEGVTSGESGEPTFAISQRFLKGVPPGKDEIEALMKSRRFRKVPDDGRIGQFFLSDSTWIRDAGRIVVTDCDPRNFVKDGDEIVPVDLIIQRVRDPRMWEMLARE